MGKFSKCEKSIPNHLLSVQQVGIMDEFIGDSAIVNFIRIAILNI